MSRPPLLTPAPGRHRRRVAFRRRRRQRRVATAGALGLVVVAGFVGKMTLATGSKGERRHGERAAVARPHRQPRAVRLSEHGFPLATPALTLTGIASPQREPVQMTFSDPPREGLLFNLSNGQVLWSLHPFERVPIASLTKMMTALLTVESAPPNAPVLITREAVEMAGSKVGVLPLGRHVQLEALLYGLLLPSGNDAAVALAQHVAGSVNAFVIRMNEQAAKLGMGCTRYSSPSGYYDAGNFSCAGDLAILAHVDMEQPRIASVVHTYSAVLPFPIPGGKLYLYNNNPLLIYGYPGATGMKTGQTEAAGRCLVATAERHGVRLGAIVLNSDAPGTQARDLLNAGFEDVYHQQPIPEAPYPPGA